MNTEIPEEVKISYNHIAIEGVLRSGKTKLAKLLAEKMGGQSVFDRVDNPYLKSFYQEKEGAAFLSQLVYLVNRYHQQSSLMQRDLFQERIICDYIFEKDKIYAYQTLTDEELIVYGKIYSIFVERIVKPDLTIFLQVSLPTIRKRIAKKGNELEKNISEKYLRDVVEAFDYFFFNYQATPLLVVKADDLEFDCDEDIDDLIEKIQQLKKSPLFYVPISKSSQKSKG